VRTNSADEADDELADEADELDGEGDELEGDGSARAALANAVESTVPKATI
jgi:hypothetical protein